MSDAPGAARDAVPGAVRGRLPALGEQDRSMIRRTIHATKTAVYSLNLPNRQMNGMPTPAGTGFFVSPEGWFVTAGHVVRDASGPRTDIDQAWLMKEARPGQISGGMCEFAQLDFVDEILDFALLKFDWKRNAIKDHLRGLDGFPHLTCSSRALQEGEPVYSFGYPLPEPRLLVSSKEGSIGHGGHAPRTTSAIVASTMDRTLVASSGSEPLVYVLDKALNYGNSGGPIVATETGHVHAFCSRFQPVTIPQPFLRNAAGQPLPIQVPSLYGIVTSLHNPGVLEQLRARGIDVVSD